MKNTSKAPRNRTLELEEGEIAELESKLLEPHALKEPEIESIVNKVIHGDLLEAMEKIPDCFADLIILDPPYNLTKTFSTKTFKATNSAAYASYLRTWFPAVVKKLKPGGSLYMCGDWKCTAAMQEVLEEHLFVMNRISWQREKGRGAKSNWKNAMEDIWFAVKDSKGYYFDVDAVKQKRQVVAPYRQSGKPKDWEETAAGNFRLTHPSNFWDDITVPYWSMPENTPHPTQKPEKLFAKLILASCPEGGIVFDPFLGSGTSAAVAKKLRRDFVGIELEREYALLAQKRLEKAGQDTSIQGYVDQVFWERNTLAAQQANARKSKEN